MPRYVLIMIVVGLFCLPLMAQAPSGHANDKWEVSIFVGSSNGGDDIYPTSVEGSGTRDVGLRFAPGYLVGGRITQNLGQYLGAELDYSLANQPAEFSNLSPFIQTLSLDHRVHNVTYTVLFYGLKPNSRIRPYGFIGPGISYYDTFGVEQGPPVEITDRWKVAGIWGGGVKYWALDHVGFRFDVRDHITGVPDFGLPERGTVTTAAFDPEGMLHNWQFSVAFFYSFK
ncbi:MAG: hypothetical protein EHM61_26650 [Acidobacteria bacterium]|nr:MAG: hypothetical protein EHM61_26650 [Acidobacteriota bacterium]